MQSEAIYTGTLIEDLFKTVERAERKSEAERLAALQMAEAESWLATMNCDSKLIGVA